MAGKRERSLLELYRDDPERADALAFGRRGLLKGAGLTALGAAVGANIPFAGNMPAGLIPAALAQTPAADPAKAGPKLLRMDGKDGNLVVLGERPLVAETPENLLDDDTTPTSKFFVRNNGQLPEPVADADAWKIKIDGEVNAPMEISLGEIKQRFRPVTYRMQLECGGNGRSAFVPEARGNQWTNGGMGCAEWTGVPLRDVLQAAGLKSSAVYTGHYGADPHLSGNASQVTLSRGVRLEKAMDQHSLIVFQMNGQPLPGIHGGPVRLLYPGWAGSASHKWVTRIWIRDKEHDGQGMTGTSYRVPRVPMIPGGKAEDANMQILESMLVRSIITSPAHGTEIASGRQINLRGAAWAGEKTVRQVDVSIDYGQSWTKANLSDPKNRFDWQRWTASVTLPTQGYYEIWSRATDSDGKMQPHVAANWNPQGYGGNALHRVAVLIKA
jgi:DMSO/TMAO reductase YedYZ molybdopterin-dependent catalytic subunit